MTGTIDFTNCKKIAVEYNGREYMLKFPPNVVIKNAMKSNNI